MIMKTMINTFVEVVTGSGINNYPSTSTGRRAANVSSDLSSQIPLQSSSDQVISNDGQDSTAVGGLPVPVFGAMLAIAMSAILIQRI